MSKRMKNRDVSITQQPPFLQELQKPTAAKKIACFLSIFSLLTNLTSVPVPRIPAGRCRSQVPRGQDPAVPGKMLFLPHPAHLRSWSRGRSG